MNLKRIGIDTSKHVFTLHGVDAQDQPVLRRNLRRADLLAFFARLPPTLVVLEACGSSHHWGRELQALGHEARLIPPQYVAAFVKRGKNDRIDAEAISEATSRPGMRFVPIKSAEQQAQTSVLTIRELTVRQHTQLVNALRGHAAEFGLVAPQGPAGLGRLRIMIGHADLPVEVRESLAFLAARIDAVEADLAEVEARMKRLHKANPISRLLSGIPGVGPVGALTLALRAEPAQFRDGRHMAAWIGLVPRQHSTGGKTRLGGITRAGDHRLRQLLVLGAMSLIRRAKGLQPQAGDAAGGLDAGTAAWLHRLLARKPAKLAAIALANKMARLAWAMMTSGEAYRRQSAPA